MEYGGAGEGRIWGFGGAFAQLWRDGLGDPVPFMPQWFNSFMNRQVPVMLDMQNLIRVVKEIPCLATAIFKKADLVASARLKLCRLDKEGNPDKKDEVYKHRLLDLLHKPNPLQGRAAFLAQWSFYQDIYHDGLVYKNKPTQKGFPRTLWNLPVGEFDIHPTGKLWDQTDINGIIEYYLHKNQDANQFNRKFMPSEITRYLVGEMDQYYFGISPLVINRLVISNLQLAYKTRNILLADKGAYGILSNGSSDQDGGMPFDENERKLLEEDYHKKYGIGHDKMKLIMTNASVKWTPMSYPTKDLMLFEESEDDFCQILSMFGLLRSMFPSGVASRSKDTIGGDGKGVIEEAIKICIQTTIQQKLDEFCHAIMHDPDYGLQAERLHLYASFDHLPVMQEDQVDAENVKNVKMQAASVLTQSIISLQSQINTGAMELEAGISILENGFGLDPDIATQMLTKKKEENPADAQQGDDNTDDDEQEDDVPKLKLHLKNITLS